MTNNGNAFGPFVNEHMGRRGFLIQTAASIVALSQSSLLSPPAFAQQREDQYTGFIIVRLSSKQVDPLTTMSIADLRELAKAVGSTRLSEVLSQYPQARSSRLVTSVSPARIAELEGKVVPRQFPPRRSLNLYWRIDGRGVGDSERLIQLLVQVPIVELVYREMNTSDPAVDASNDVHSSQQFHLDAAPMGIDARWAWNQSGGSGAGVGFIDVEQGWLVALTSDPTSLQHEDLPVAKQLAGVPREMYPGTCPTRKHHGSAVLGLVAGLDDARGIVGIAPGLAWMDVASHFQNGFTAAAHVANAVFAALQHMNEGDVLLLEVQDYTGSPIESDKGVWDAIDWATSLGVIVVEAAGNGGISLDTIPGLSRSNQDADSGAIIVGAGESQLDAAGTGHERWVMQSADFALPGPIPPFLPACGLGMVPSPPFPASNHGSRVDCYAPGEHVVTAGYGWLAGTTATSSYTARFSGTSAAAAIVAGAAILLQGMHKAIKGVPLTPAQMRHALATHGTPQGTGVSGSIGVMPDLRKAAQALSLMAPAPSVPANLRVTP